MCYVASCFIQNWFKIMWMMLPSVFSGKADALLECGYTLEARYTGKVSIIPKDVNARTPELLKQAVWKP
jgi:hypothetical protein